MLFWVCVSGVSVELEGHGGWMGVGCRCPSVCNDIVTPQHLLSHCVSLFDDALPFIYLPDYLSHSVPNIPRGIVLYSLTQLN